MCWVRFVLVFDHLGQRFVKSIGNIEKSYVNFQLFEQTCPILTVLKISAILLKYPTFEGFFMLSWRKQVKS